jgi:lysyl-tRNA synthetase class II
LDGLFPRSAMIEHVRGTQHIKLRDGAVVDFSPAFRRINVLDELERKTKQSLPDLEAAGNN